jgi:hypothetical protein
VRINEVALTDFQSYRDEQRVPLDAHLTLLAGRNNAGKSALLRGLWTAHEPQYGAGDRFRLTVAVTVEADRLVAPLGDPSLADVVAQLESRPSHTLRGAFTATPTKSGVGPLDQLTFERLELLELGWLAVGKAHQNPGWVKGGVEGAATAVAELQDAVRAALGSMRYLAPARIDPSQRAMRASPQLMPEARNLAEVLFYLANNDLRRMRRIVGFMRRCFPAIEEITVAQDIDQSSASGEHGQARAGVGHHR